MGNGLKVRLIGMLPNDRPTTTLAGNSVRVLSFGGKDRYTLVHSGPLCNIDNEQGGTQLQFNCEEAVVAYAAAIDDKKPSLIIQDKYHTVFEITEREMDDPFADEIDLAFNRSVRTHTKIEAINRLITQRDRKNYATLLPYEIGVAALMNLASSANTNATLQLHIGDYFHSIGLPHLACDVGTIIATSGHYQAFNRAKGAQLVTASGYSQTTARDLYDQIFLSPDRDGPALLLILSGYISLGDKQRIENANDAIANITGIPTKPKGALAESGY